MYVASWEKKSEKEYNNIGGIVCDLIIRMTLMVKRDYIKNLWLYIYIYMKWVQVTPSVTSQNLHLLWTIDYY